eukprot:1327093-Pyramimonas_sp.AAC.1
MAARRVQDVLLALVVASVSWPPALRSPRAYTHRSLKACLRGLLGSSLLQVPSCFKDRVASPRPDSSGGGRRPNLLPAPSYSMCLPTSSDR